MKRILILTVVLLLSGGFLFAQAAKSGVDIKKDELLCSYGQGSPEEVEFFVGKVLKPASADTKNQAQVIYVKDGSKAWVDYVIASHKAKKNEIVVDALVFYPGGWEEYNDMSLDDYRKAGWNVGRITATDEMFKDLVEIGGHKFNWKLIRLPDDPASLEPKSE